MPAQTVKRGAIPSPRHLLAAAVPFTPVGAPPTFLVKPAKLSMWGNRDHGDCVTAEEAFAKACNSPEIFIPEADAIAWAARHGVLEGATLVEVLSAMQNDGFAEDPFVYDDGGYFAVNWTDPSALQSAISRGPVKIGVAANQIETAYWKTGGASGWFGTGFTSDPNEDHCVSLCGYGPIAWLADKLNVAVPAGVDGTKSGYAMFTWSSIGIVDEPSMVAVTHEAWLRQPTTVTKTTSHWSSWAGLAGGITQIATAVNRDGRIEVFAIGTDRALNHIWQVTPGGGWSGWAGLAGGITQIATAVNQDGRLEVFAIGTDGALNHIWQTSPGGGWSSWAGLAGGITRIATAVNHDGRIEVFAIGTDKRLNHIWQTTPNGAWSDWANLAGGITEIATAVNRDGRIEVFAIGTDGALNHIWQTTPGGGWNAWAGLAGGITKLATAVNTDGRIEVFAIGTDRALNHIWQTTAGGAWSGWAGLAGGITQLAAEVNRDGRLEVFAIGTDAALNHIWQVTPGGSWSGWSGLRGGITQLATAVNRDGRIEVFAIGTDRALNHIWQTIPGG